MLASTIFVTTGTGQNPVGVITLQDGACIGASAEGYETLVETILNHPVVTPDGKVSREDDAIAWFAHLSTQYNGSHLRIGKPEEIEDEDLEDEGDDSAADYSAVDTEFKESEHPRIKSGKGGGEFTNGSGGLSRGEVVKKKTTATATNRFPESESAPAASKKPNRILTPAKVVDGKRVTPDGSPLPQHIQALKLPPAWTDVQFSNDPDADLLATGRDKKGRLQPVYSERFAATQAQYKFERVKALHEEFDRIEQQNEAARKSKETADVADCLRLIMQTGIRPGSDTDTKARQQAYGASTLLGQHVRTIDGKVILDFVGKEGVALQIPVSDPETAAMLKKRAKAAGPTGRLFGATTDKALLRHSHSLDAGNFKTKDFRTLMGTRTAISAIAELPAPSNEKEYQKSVLEVAKQVSKKLGNKPKVALQSYINPTVWSAWRASSGV